MAAIFISFIHEEEYEAKLMGTFLQQLFGEDVDTFRSSDQNAIYAGEEWMARVFEELKTAKVLISMLSPTSVSRPWINFEAGAAWMRDTKVIPVCFGGLTIGNLPKPYSSLQAVVIDSPAACYYLAASIAHHLGKQQPEWPDFSGMSAMGGRDPEKDKELARPYRRLSYLINLKSSGPAEDPGPPTQ
jgi:hypothetical protein